MMRERHGIGADLPTDSGQCKVALPAQGLLEPHARMAIHSISAQPGHASRQADRGGKSLHRSCAISGIRAHGMVDVRDGGAYQVHPDEVLKEMSEHDRVPAARAGNQDVRRCRVGESAQQ